jgi:hypothetical protein
LNPLHFNQLNSTALAPNNVCGDVWFQYSWQHSDRVGREDIGMAIQAAEQEIAREVGFNLLPDWTKEERLNFTAPAQPGVYNISGVNPRGMLNSVELRRGHVIAGGVKTKTLIQAGAVIVRTDADVDGYAETCTVVVATTVTDANEIRVFYPGKAGNDYWEIRPITVAISGGNATITFKAWQVSAANQMDAINADVLDAEAAGSYETTVDAYRVWNDPSTQVQFMWESNLGDCCGTCVACQFSTQAGCFHLREARLGLAVPSSAAWNSTDEAFDLAEWTACRAPDQVRFWYYSGWQNPGLDRPKVQMDPYWEYAVAYFAASKLDRPVCGCSNVQQFIEKWRRDSAFSSQEEGGFTVTPELMANKLGTSMGAIYAYKQVHRNGVRIIK